MAKTGFIMFRVSFEEHEKIKYDAQAEGISISSYLRNLALKRNLLLESKIFETHRLLKKFLESKNE